MSVAGIFPGQSSEYVGMLKPLVGVGITEEIFDRINSFANLDIKSLALNGPDDVLRQSLNAQLAVFGTNASYWHLIKNRYKFSVLAGHSLGFYSALYASEAVSLEDCIKIIIAVYDAIEKISGKNKWRMAAVIGLRIKEIEDICKNIGDVFVANINSATQVAISGSEDAVIKASNIALTKGALNVKNIPIPYPLHSPFMNGIDRMLMHIINDIKIKEPIMSVLDHTSGEIISKDKIGNLLLSQLTKKVLWKDSVIKIVDSGITSFIEIGPSDVLSKLVQWIYRDADTMSAEEILSCQIV